MAIGGKVPGLKTLSMGEFQRTPAWGVAQKKGLTPQAAYQNYLRFVARRRASKIGEFRADPLAPTPDVELRSRVAQAVRGQVDPLIQDISRGVDRDAAAIERETMARTEFMRPFQDRSADVFRTAQLRAAGVGDVLASTLKGSGEAAAGGLRAALEGIGAPSALVGEVAGGTSQFATGAANAGLVAQGSVLSELLSRGAEAENFAGLLPAFARAEGARDVSERRYQGAQDIRGLREKIPGLTADMLGSERDREVQKAIAKLGLQETQYRTQAQAQADAASAAQPDPSLSQGMGILVDSNGNPITKNGQVVPYGVADDQADAAKDARAARADAVKAKGNALTGAEAKARSLSRTLFKGEKVKTPGKGGSLIDPGGSTTTIKRKSWSEAYRIVYNEIAGELERRYGVKRDRISAIVRQALIDAGFKPPAATPSVSPGLRDYPR